MAIAFDIGILLAQTVVKNKLKGRVLQLGRQDMFMNEEQMFAMLRHTQLLSGEMDFTHPALITDVLRRSSYFRTDGSDKRIDERVFFAMLGLEAFSSDVTDHEGADHILDLNADFSDKDRERLGSYDIVLDGGTMEHVFNTQRVLNAIHNLLGENGVVIHINPVNGAPEHGFYQFSPTFYWDYYLANGYEVLESKFIMRTAESALPNFVECTPEIIDLAPAKVIFRGAGHIFIAARKLPGSTSGIIPTQRFYARRPGKPTSPVSEFQRWRIEQALAECPRGSVCVWCAGLYAEALLESAVLQEKAFCVVDSNPDKHGETLHGLPVISPEAFQDSRQGVSAVLVATPSSVAVYHAISSQLPERARIVLA